MTKTWGWRYGKGERDDTFRTSNPYRATELSDRFGIHCTLSNPEVEIKEHNEITISKAYWHDSDDAPEIVKASEHIRADGAGHLFIHGDEWFRGEPYTQYKDFMRRADPDFRLVAEGQEEIKGSLSSLYITHESRAIREIEIRIPPAEYAKMARGVSYRLVPVNSKDEYQWKVEDSIRIRKR